MPMCAMPTRTDGSAEIEARLFNWARCYRRSERPTRRESDRGHPRAVDELDAARVERVMSQLRNGKACEYRLWTFIRARYLVYDSDEAVLEWFRRDRGAGEAAYRLACREMQAEMTHRLPKLRVRWL